uniref:UDP-glycosyltransferase UGT34A8 n=1 Tax=Chilo suppressalis TaxID=168631 RepID=A0A481XUL5_CHISP|nr:UDP-glycosyltransferase UGT34A8 [Chilo suppressalis]
MGFIRLQSVFFVFFLLKVASSAHILVVFSSLSFADHLIFRGFVSLLTQRGHAVVLMTPYPGHFQYPDSEKIVELDVGGESAPFWEEYKELLLNTDDHFPRQRTINELMLKIAVAQLRSKPMQALFINPHIKFDLVITEADVPLLYAVAEKYSAPHIALTTTTGRIHQHEAKGNPVYPTFYLDVNTHYDAKNMTAWQKVTELYRLISTRNEYFYNYLPLCELAAKKILGLRRDLLEVEYDIDLLIIANNPALAGVRPLVPGVVHADRMHIKSGILAPDLKIALDTATKGAIYFSLGAMQDSENLAAPILQTLIDVFGELPFTVLWRMGNTTAVNLPRNVVARPWFPQQDVLAHPNMKAFITSGGSRSLEEAVYYLVPIVGFPLQRARIHFMKQITRFNAGEILDPYDLDKEAMKSIILAVANNESYKKSITNLRDLIIDPSISGPEKTIWWIEYVLKHKGAKHLRSPGVGVGFYQSLMLDLLFYINIGILLILFLILIILRLIVRRLLARFLGDTDLDSKYKLL